MNLSSLHSPVHILSMNHAFYPGSSRAAPVQFVGKSFHFVGCYLADTSIPWCIDMPLCHSQGILQPLHALILDRIQGLAVAVQGHLIDLDYSRAFLVVSLDMKIIRQIIVAALAITMTHLDHPIDLQLLIRTHEGVLAHRRRGEIRVATIFLEAGQMLTNRSYSSFLCSNPKF